MHQHLLLRSVAFVFAAAFVALGCAKMKLPAMGHRAETATITGAHVQDLDLNNPLAPQTTDYAISLSAAKNEWASFAVEVSGLPASAAKKNVTLRVRNLTSAGVTIDAKNFSAYQILSMPIDVNRAGFVRHTGLTVTSRVASLPRALLPISMNDGAIDFAAARNQNSPLMFWIDLHVPTETPAGEYTASCDLVEGNVSEPIASVPVKVRIYDFVLPDERHLSMVSRIEWESLRRLYPHYETVEPQYMSRNDKRYGPAINTLDDLVRLAEANRTEVIVPRLEPTVKWPDGRPPQVNFDDYDTVVAPWLTGRAFADHVPLGFWPLPECEGLGNYPILDRLEYWAAVASHFDQLDWIRETAVFLDYSANLRNHPEANIELSILAARLLNTQSRLRVMLPLEEGQIMLANPNDPTFVDPGSVDRLLVAAPSLVSNSPLRVWPKDMKQASHWLRTDTPGLVPYVGAGGDERDVRLWAWLAFLRKQSNLILWGNALPSTSSPTVPADPNELIWFYPGSWFGVDQPVPSIQLKWLRRAQEDYEYLWLAKQRGQLLNANLLARLITKPVELQPGQAKDPEYAMMSGTADPQAWADAMDLIAKTILDADPAQPADKNKQMALDLEMLRWAKPLERPTIIARSTTPTVDPGAVGANAPVNMKIGIDIYNASDATPDQNTLQWMTAPAGWIFRPQPTLIPALPTYRVQRFTLDAQVDPSKIDNTDRRPIELLFTEPEYKISTTEQMYVPVAASDRHPPGLVLDGSLGDWTGDDALQDGPLVQLMNRPALQSQQIQPASTSSAIYSGWTDESFYVAFRLQGLSDHEARATKNFASYQFRRAWGEDLCQILIQPVYRDSSTGPVLHLLVKPNGSCNIERKGGAMSMEEWPAFAAPEVHYIATLDGPVWRGEIAIPWKTISAEKGRPVLLRFNFTQHRTDTGESASWAGPIDFGRDDALMGLLFIRDNGNVGAIGAGNSAP